MRLAQFIVAHTQAILASWEAFASTILPAANMDSLTLRDHAGDILLATVRDMESVQTVAQQYDTPADRLGAAALTLRLNGASQEHAIGRLGSGFNLMQLVSEYRALRASVLALWRDTLPAVSIHDVDDVNLFHESIDESLATAVSCYTTRVDESRNKFLSNHSHDLRNPLNAITMSTLLLPTTGQANAETAELSTRISNSANVMASMISDLLDYTRTRLGAGMPVTLAPMHLGLLCHEVIDEYRSADPTLNLLIESTGDLTGQWDAARLRQVFSNLLGNAIQHGDGRTPIELTLLGTRAEIIATVRNHGQPIPHGELDKIFDPLVRGEIAAKAKQRRPGSIGLGLYIARELVNAHGGTIAVESSAKAGTLFTIHLPRNARGSTSLIKRGASLAHN